MSTQHAPFCKCSDPNCPAVTMMRKISAMPTNGDVWSIETVAGFTMATTAAVKNRLDVVQVICCQMVNPDMTEEQMRPEFERVLQGQDLYGNTAMHYFALRANDVAIRELLQVGGCMCIRFRMRNFFIAVARGPEPSNSKVCSKRPPS